MAEAAGRVTETDAEAPRDPQPIEADIVRRRAELTRLVGELNRRGHEFTRSGSRFGDMPWVSQPPFLPWEH